MKLLILLILPLLAVCISLPQIRRLQSAAVKGKLLCNGKPYEKARLKFYEVDPVKDTLMAEGLSNGQGTFELHGKDTEWTTIDPKLNIYHNCEDEAVECWRKVEIHIPDEFVSDGEVAQKIFDIGVLNLNAKLPGETRDCLN
ncbi:unnamed protein product [Auanema sp. JU1783]|nr:unnamed protein product [Auanema sp. JU1783]